MKFPKIRRSTVPIFLLRSIPIFAMARKSREQTNTCQRGSRDFQPSLVKTGRVASGAGVRSPDPYLLRVVEAKNQSLVAGKSGGAECDSDTVMAGKEFLHGRPS